MFKEIVIHANFGKVTGYQIHASNFFPLLEKINRSEKKEGTVHISLLDVVSAAHTTIRHPAPSILYNVWESTEYPAEFMDKIRLYDQLWVASEWQRACSIAQGIPEEFVKVVPEGVDPEQFKPIEQVYHGTFDFLMVGKWEPRKSNLEICKSFLAGFPPDRYPDVRLYLSCDTLFHCDQYKSTEERLEAYGINDSRIIPVHFEERDVYIRRLQDADVFVSCSRAEGWGLPIIEAMACGIPTIVADWSGSTEYAMDALKVRVVDFKKPEGIFGNWDVPGVWGEPDYNHLTEVMRDAYDLISVMSVKCSTHKEKALITSEMIRTKFSWQAAAEKAYDILEELSKVHVDNPVDKLVERLADLTHNARVLRIKKEASRLGFELHDIQKRKEIFTINTWPDTEEKMDTLRETINQIRTLGIPVLVSSHYPLPEDVIKLADYYLFEQRDIMSGDDKPIYWRRKLDGTEEHKQASVEYQGVAALNGFRNSIDFCKNRFDWIYDMGSDMEVDLIDWIDKVRSSDAEMVCIPYEGMRDGIGGGLWAGKSDVLDKVIPYLNSWEQYANMYPDVKFVAERWIFNYVSSVYDVNKIDWIECETQNRFDNVDREIWEDDEFQCNFIGGPYLNIVGISNREYNVVFENPIDGESYGLMQKAGVWSRPTTKYYREWTVSASLNGELKYQHKIDLKGKRVLISFGSKAFGDTLAWIPYVEEFRKKHECHVVCSTWWNKIMDYPEIEFVLPGAVVEEPYASYEIGCFDGQLDKNVSDWRVTTLQKVSADILGIDYEPIRPRLKYKKNTGNGHPYICFSEFSTMRNKLWNREGAWQKIIDYLVSLGYECVSISGERSELKNVTRHNGQSIEQSMTDLSGAEFYVGLNHGPIWLAYGLGIPCLMITGVSEEFNDFPNPYRVAIDTCRPGCFNDPSIPIDRGFEWCPRKRDYACTREITEEMVISAIDRIRGDLCQRKSENFPEVGIKLGPQTVSTPKGQVSGEPKSSKDSLMRWTTDGDQPRVMG